MNRRDESREESVIDKYGAWRLIWKSRGRRNTLMIHNSKCFRDSTAKQWRHLAVGVNPRKSPPKTRKAPNGATAGLELQVLSPLRGFRRFGESVPHAHAWGYMLPPPSWLNPVVRRGPDGSCDSWAVQFYGSVIRHPDSGQFKMWYVAESKEDRLDSATPRSVPWRAAYAESFGDSDSTGGKHGAAEVNGHLLEIDRELGKAIEELIGIVTLATFYRCVRDESDKPGRKNFKGGRRKRRERCGWFTARSDIGDLRYVHRQLQRAHQQQPAGADCRWRFPPRSTPRTRRQYWTGVYLAAWRRTCLCIRISLPSLLKLTRSMKVRISIRPRP